MAPVPLSLLPPLLVCVVTSVMSCLQCDHTIRNMHEDFLCSVKGVTVQDLMDLQSIIEHAYTSYQKTSTQLRGVTDPTTLYQARTEYQNEFRRYWQEHKTGPIQGDMIKAVEKGRRILQKHLQRFVTEVHRLDVEESGQVVLDCFLSWHSLIVGQAEYHYSWKQGERNFTAEDGFEPVVVTEDSKIVLNQLSRSEQGVYRCLLLDKHGTELSRMFFLLTVIPLPTSTPRPIPTLPSLPTLDYRPVRLHRDTLIIILALLTVLSISASLAIVVVF
ncbi:hypothetical protein NFI96_033323, partial [Prochilodus magdalenae]